MAPIPSTNKNNSDFIYVPSINLYVSKERTHFNKNWNQCQGLLHSNNEKMLTIPEFVEFLKYTKENHQDVYHEIIDVRSPWRAEWLDADFKVKGKNLIVHYHVFDSNGNIIKKSEEIDKNTLMEDKTPGISLENWLENSTKQGLPKKNTRLGNLHYLAPMEDNNSVAGFDTNLYCDMGPSDWSPVLGGRAAKLRE